MKRMFLLTVICVFAFSMLLFGCDKQASKMDNQYSAVTAAVNDQLEIFTCGDIAKINAMLFSTDKPENMAGTKAEYENLNPGPEDKDVGVLGSLMALAKVTVESMNDTSITYNVKSPDMEFFFKSCVEKQTEFESERDLAELIIQYAKSADLREFHVEVPYSYIDGELSVDYTNQDFINAILGGLVDVYIDLYQSAITEYKEGMGE